MNDLESTLIRRGRRATTFSDMVEFTQSVHQQPFEMVLKELPALASLSDTKFNLATKVLRRRFRTERGVDQVRMRAEAEQIARSVSSTFTANRIRSIFEFEEA
ncbi:MAG TPA: hypothetical protein VM779_11695 [Thermoanaerobaculia bacterium]|nr:hypothetical protein [Thermoanaerobaculia bacterium]